MMSDDTAPDIAWAAGFLEGEGYFAPQDVRAAQVDKEPLERLVALLGGRIYLDVRPNSRIGRQQPIHRWSICGTTADECIRRLWPWLSHRRRLQCVYSQSDPRRPGRNPQYEMATGDLVLASMDQLSLDLALGAGDGEGV